MNANTQLNNPTSAEQSDENVVPESVDGPAGASPNENDPTEVSSVDEVYTQLLLKIAHGELPGGTVLTSIRVAKQLHVSRTPVVAALDRLVADGLLNKQRNKRAVVSQGAVHWLAQIHQLREIVEPPAAALAATRITEDALKKLDLFSRLVVPGGFDGWTIPARRFDTALHLAIAEFCGNLPLRQTIFKCWSFKRLIFDAGYDDPHMSETGYREHVAIVQALARHDAVAASAAMQYHLRSAAHLRSELGID